MGKAEDHTEDALRSFPITLPKLASPHERNAALLAGDWLTQIKPLRCQYKGRSLVGGDP